MAVGDLVEKVPLEVPHPSGADMVSNEATGAVVTLSGRLALTRNRVVVTIDLLLGRTRERSEIEHAVTEGCPKTLVHIPGPHKNAVATSPEGLV